MRKSDRAKTARKSKPAKRSKPNKPDRGGSQSKNRNVQSEFHKIFQGPILVPKQLKK
tara:strand:- start:336 stop:506 length:171 start_codon:yes stop_codon:yes gene_type:complete